VSKKEKGDDCTVHGEPCDGRSTYVFRKRQRGTCHQKNIIFEEKFYLGKYLYSILVLSGLQPGGVTELQYPCSANTHSLYGASE